MADKLIDGYEFELTLELKHDHLLYERTDPLLGERRISIWLCDDLRLLDDLDLNECEMQLDKLTLSLERPENHLCSDKFHSPPDSLLLWSEFPGSNFLRFVDVPVRPGTAIRLKFWYLISPGTGGECRARVCEYNDKPSAYIRMPDRMDILLAGAPGKWHHAEYELLVSPCTNTVAVDFRLISTDPGELWIDDAALDYVVMQRPYQFSRSAALIRP